MMIPVLGIVPAYQGPVGKGLPQGRGQQQGRQHHGPLEFVDHGEQEEEEGAAGERHSGGGVIMWHAGGSLMLAQCVSFCLYGCRRGVS